jgi:hypothetical protein
MRPAATMTSVVSRSVSGAAITWLSLITSTVAVPAVPSSTSLCVPLMV